MDAKVVDIKEKLEKSLKQTSDLAAQLLAAQQAGKVPHYDDIEIPAHDLGKRLSRAIQGERMRELALQERKGTRCPDCNRTVRIEIEVRGITSMDGPIELTEPVAQCRHCRRSFFPSKGRIGTRRASLDARASTPGFKHKVVFVNAEIRSLKRSTELLSRVLEIETSTKTIERICFAVGNDLEVAAKEN